MKAIKYAKYLPDGSIIIVNWKNEFDQLELRLLNQDNLTTILRSRSQLIDQSSTQNLSISQNEYIEYLYHALSPFQHQTQTLSCTYSGRDKKLKILMLKNDDKIEIGSIQVTDGDAVKAMSMIEKKQFMSEVINKISQELYQQQSTSQSFNGLSQDQYEQLQSYIVNNKERETEILQKCLLLLNEKKQKIEELEEQINNQ